MSTTILQEGQHTAEFLLSEGNGGISREQVTFAAGDALPPGQLLGVVTASGKYKPYNPADTGGSATGTAVAAGILYAALEGSAGDRAGVVIVRLAEVAGAKLTGLTDAAKADLKTRNIIVR
ncbi:MAG: head decoration protein [Zoogloeaceae bacterium]|jgi:hypothetical protein|nr:head decoration protein [Zoogloeaceae bacterium]